jgi:hypothetical protein
MLLFVVMLQAAVLLARNAEEAPLWSALEDWISPQSR